MNLKCTKCGYQRKPIRDEDYECPICNADMIKENHFGSTSINANEEVFDSEQNLETEILPQYFIESFRYNIEILGHERTWQIIEEMKNPLTRIAYRKGFLEAGGKAPESEVKL